MKSSPGNLSEPSSIIFPMNSLWRNTDLLSKPLGQWASCCVLISPKAFREAREAYAIMEGMDREMAARRVGHTVRTQEQNYAKYDAIRARDLADKHRSEL